MNRLRMLVMVGVVIGLAACDKKDEHMLPRAGAGEAAEEAKTPAAAMNMDAHEREQFLFRAQQEVAELGIRIETLRKQAQLATGELQPKILALDQEMKNLQAKLAELKATATGAWTDIKTDVESATGHLRDAVDKASGKGKSS